MGKWARKDLMDERDRRYEQHFGSVEAAVILAKEAQDKKDGTVNIVGLVAGLSLVFAGLSLGLAALMYFK